MPETYTFWDLHVAIQDVMGWEDYHLHEFNFTLPLTKIKVCIGIPMEDDLEETMLPGWEINIHDLFTLESPNGDYYYDFGDGWQHSVTLEKVLPREAGVIYPRCIDGKRACPPEDCGGIGRYAEFLEAIRDPAHELHEDMLDWIGGEFDPEDFDANEVKFDDPAKRFKIAFG